MAGKAALPQPTHHIPAEHPPRHGDRGLSFGTERLGMGRAGARGAMRELADQMQGPSERQHPMMAMVTHGQRTAARPAPLLLDCQFDACELRVCWPAIRHEGPLLFQDRLGNHHTIYTPICVLAFYRIVVYKNGVKQLVPLLDNSCDKPVKLGLSIVDGQCVPYSRLVDLS